LSIEGLITGYLPAGDVFYVLSLGGSPARELPILLKEMYQEEL